MHRSAWASALVLAIGCTTEKAAPPAATPPGDAAVAAVASGVGDAVKQLSDPQQAVRDSAAVAVRKALAANANAASDRFTGKWVTYFVNGLAENDIQYTHGEYQRFTTYYDNGQLAYEQRYVGGKIDGPELGYHRDGKRAYAIEHAMGKSVGRWLHWFPNGKVETEQTYVDGELDGSVVHWREDGTKSSRMDYRNGKETGQAAWDEHGKLLYARGTASAESGRGTSP